MSKKDSKKKTYRDFTEYIEDEHRVEIARLRKDVDDLKEITMGLRERLND
jgi:hypothetical protein